MGGEGDEVFWGGGDTDALNGRGGNDVFDGDTGQDSITGGAGDDNFTYQSISDSPAGSFCDYIYDFDDAGNDRISMQIVGGMSYIGTSSFSGVAPQVRINDIAGPHLVVEANLDGNPLTVEFQVLLLNTDASQMGADDFVFL